MMLCPMTIEFVEMLTDAQVECFCSKGCSADCPALLDQYVKKIKRSCLRK